MKRIFKTMLLVLAVLALASCSPKKSTENAPSETKGKVLNLYNWGEYIGENVIANFEKEFNVKVNYSLFDSNEVLYTKLLGGSKYDVIIPSDYMIERLIKEKLLLPIDWSKITNKDNLYQPTMHLPNDPENKYSVPYMWGSVGIVYNTKKIDTAKIEKLGYNILKDPEYLGRVYMYDSERDSFMIALKALGYSMNTEDEAQIEKAYQWLLELDTAVKPAYVTDEVIDDMTNGEKDLAVVYSGDAAYILANNPDMGYYIPTEGTNIWVDAMVIPANAANPDLAHEFINYILTYEASLDNSETVGYASSNTQVLEELSGPGGTYADNVAYLVKMDNPNDEMFKHNEVMKKKLSELWIKVKSR